MLTWFVLGLIGLGVVLLLIHLFVNTDPKVLARGLVWSATVLLMVVLIVLAASGRLSWLFVAVPVILTWVGRARMAADVFRLVVRLRGKSPFRPGSGASRVETHHLRMTIDPVNGRMDGEIIAGARAGEKLSRIDIFDLIALLLVYADTDPPSAHLVADFLDRERPGWRDNPRAAQFAAWPGAGNFASGPMTRDEALKILGLEEGVAESAIRAAHRRLIAALHPDQGGSSYLAAKINQARDTLLSGRK